MKHSVFRKTMRALLLALPFLATAGFAQNNQPVVRHLDALDSSSAVGTQPPAPAAQIRSLWQSAHQRVLPRTTVLPMLTNSQAALSVPAPAPAPGQPLQIGVARALSDTADAAATAGLLAWTRAADGSLRAAISVRALGAKGLRLGLRIEQLPPGTLLRVYGPDAAETTEITAAEVLRTIHANLDAGDNSAAAYIYWLPLVEGEESALEIQLPAGVSPSQLKVSLPTVSHLTMLPNEIKASSGIGASGKCNVDATCTSGNQNEIRAVARMSYVSAGGAYYCTGTLLNNAKQDRTPYFLTANHCISTQTAASTLQTDWNFRSNSCGSLQTDSSYQRISGGATLLYNTTTTDTSFMRLNSNPPSTVMFAGWNSNTPAVSTGSAVFGLHHPKGDLEKYSSGSLTSYGSCGTANALGYVYCTPSSTLGNNGFYNIIWSQGTVEEGSSGSALFTASGREVIGQLSNGSADCSNPRGSNMYGRFDLPFNAALYKWLGTATASTTTYTVTASAGTGGSINPSGSLSTASGTTRSFTLTPNANYQVSSVTGTCGGTRNGNTFTTNTITSNCTVVANFTYAQTQYYTVTASAGTGGSISPSGSLSTASGTTRSFTLTPSANYQVSSVTGTCGGTRNGNTFTTNTITSDCTVVANFTYTPAQTQYYTVTASAGTGGSISPSGSLSTASGTTRSFTLTPSANYQVSSVTGTCGGTRNGNTFTTNTITSNCTVVANFTYMQYYTVTASAGTGGSINPSGSLSTASGTTRSFSLTPNVNYQVSSVTGTCGGTRNGNTFTTNTITSNCTVVANFTYSPTYYTVTASAGTGGSISPSGSLSTASGTTRSFTLTPSANYQVSSVTGTCGGTRNGNTFTTYAITSNCTVVANFTYTQAQTQYYTVTASAGTGGSISPSGSLSTASGTTRSFTLSPNANYQVSSVTGTCGGTRNGNTFTTNTITSDCTVVANFTYTQAQTQYYTVTASAGTGGSISPSGSLSTASGTTRSFTLSPNANYQVSSVTGTCGGTRNGNTFTTNVITSNCTVVANFTYTQAQTQNYTVTASASMGGSISPSGNLSTASGTTRTFTLTSNVNYRVSSVTGTCGGTLTGNIFTTNAITSDCTVVANFSYAPTYYTVTASAGTGGSISPSGSLSVPAGTTLWFMLTPNANYQVSSVTGTCGGTLHGNIYTTSVITASCTVSAVFR